MTPVLVAEPIPFNEQARRLPTFTAGIPIVLANGEAWHFPKPRIRYDPVFDEAGKVHLQRTRIRLAPEIDGVLDRVIEAETDAEVLESSLEMAVFALRMNYAIEPGELGRLIYYVTDDDANLAMWRDLVGFARGDLYAREGEEPPKPSAVG